MLPLDIPAMASKGVPVLCIDTCSLLDIMRDPTREDALPVHRQAACDLVAALEQGKFHCLIADQVAVEFAQRDTLIQREALDSLKRLEGLVVRTNRLHAVLPPSVDLNSDAEGTSVSVRVDPADLRLLQKKINQILSLLLSLSL